MTWALALVLRPLVLLFLIAFLFAPAVYAVRRWMPEGKLKRVLLLRIHDGERYTFIQDWRNR